MAPPDHANAATKSDGAASLDSILEMSGSYVPARCLSTGIQLGVFSHIAAGKEHVDEIARAAEASQRGMRMLLDSLAVLGLIVKHEDRYQLGESAREYLVRGGENYMGYMLENDALWQNWANLAEVVRTGKPPHHVERKEAAAAFFPDLVRSLYVMNRGQAEALAKVLTAKKSSEPLSVLDVACGSGIWGIAVAEADPASRVTFHDFPKLLDVTRGYLDRCGLTDRGDFLPGNLREVDFGEERFDAALLGHIVHSEGERSSRDLFKRIHRALRPGGRIVVIDIIPNEERTGPLEPITFALTMLLFTEEGDTFTLSEYTDWLTEAGFGPIETADIGSQSPAIIGFKK